MYYILYPNIFFIDARLASIKINNAIVNLIKNKERQALDTEDYCMTLFDMDNIQIEGLVLDKAPNLYIKKIPSQALTF